MKNIDKIYHFLAGFIIAMSISFLYDPLYGLTAGFLAGAAKEALDEYRYGGADIYDFYATVLGTFAGVVLWGLLL